MFIYGVKYSSRDADAVISLSMEDVLEYSEERFRALSEKEAIYDSLQNLCPMLFDVLEEARADVKARYPSDLFTERQNRGNISRMVSQRSAKLWDERSDGSWVLCDRRGFLRIMEASTGLPCYLRRVDPITGGLAKANPSSTDRAFFSQQLCLGPGELTPMEKNLFSTHNRISPKLDRSHIILAWSGEIDGPISLTAYRPIESGRFGAANKWDFSLALHGRMPDISDMEFIPTDGEENLLPTLIVDEEVPDDLRLRPKPERITDDGLDDNEEPENKQ